jgi:hypothetical protein
MLVMQCLSRSLQVPSRKPSTNPAFDLHFIPAIVMIIHQPSIKSHHHGSASNDSVDHGAYSICLIGINDMKYVWELIEWENGEATINSPSLRRRPGSFFSRYSSIKATRLISMMTRFCRRRFLYTAPQKEM